MDARLVLAAALCFVCAVREAVAADLKCYTCESITEENCKDPFKVDKVTSHSCSHQCYKVKYEVSGADAYQRGCLPTDDCDTLDKTLSFLKAIPGVKYEGVCCKDKDNCNAATSLGMTKMAAFICSFMAIFAWMQKI